MEKTTLLDSVSEIRNLRSNVSTVALDWNGIDVEGPLEFRDNEERGWKLRHVVVTYGGLYIFPTKEARDLAECETETTGYAYLSLAGCKTSNGIHPFTMVIEVPKKEGDRWIELKVVFKSTTLLDARIEIYEQWIQAIHKYGAEGTLSSEGSREAV